MNVCLLGVWLGLVAGAAIGFVGARILFAVKEDQLRRELDDLRRRHREDSDVRAASVIQILFNDAERRRRRGFPMS